MKIVLMAVGLAAMVGCASTGGTPGQPKVLKPTVTIRNYPAADAIAKFSQGCLQQGGSLEQVGPMQAICARPMDDSMRSTLIRALATPAYSTNPVYRARFSVIENGGQTTLQVDPWIEYQNAYGQVTKIPYTNQADLQNVQSAFDREKAQWEATHP
jgi:hypothetical protein